MLIAGLRRVYSLNAGTKSRPFTPLGQSRPRLNQAKFRSGGLPLLAFFGDRAHMFAMSKNFDPTDYSVVVKNRAPLPKPWRWEIYCAGKRQPIQRSDIFFESREQASSTGKEALKNLLEKLQA